MSDANKRGSTGGGGAASTGGNSAGSGAASGGGGSAGGMGERRMNPVGWFEIYVSDMKRAEAFYQAMFGFEFGDMPVSKPDMPMRAFPGMGDMEAMGITGALVKHADVKPGPAGTLVYFPVASCKEAVTKAKEMGMRVYLEAESLGKYGNIAVFADSEGNAIGVHSRGE
ncbi:MAG: VOC family protein [Proteobacteria bacterium]|nr:VOC family protein [Pseudomonadota bacterium]